MKFSFITHGEITEEQLDQIATLKSTVWSYPLDEHRRWMAANLIPEDIHLMLYSDNTSGNLIGYLTLNSIEVDGKSCVGIGNVCVHRDFHGRGIGLLLMKLAEYHILNSHLCAWLLCKPTVAHFYERCGWTKFEGTMNYNGKVVDCCIYKLSRQPEPWDSLHCLNRIF